MTFLVLHFPLGCWKLGKFVHSLIHRQCQNQPVLGFLCIRGRRLYVQVKGAWLIFVLAEFSISVLKSDEQIHWLRWSLWAWINPLYLIKLLEYEGFCEWYYSIQPSTPLLTQQIFIKVPSRIICCGTGKDVYREVVRLVGMMNMFEVKDNSHIHLAPVQCNIRIQQ